MLSKCIINLLSRCIYLMFDFCDVMPPMLGFVERPRGELNAVCLCY